MINAILAAQLSTVDTLTDPQDCIVARNGGLGFPCPTGVLSQVTTLAAASSNVPLTFPTGVTTAAVIYIAAITTTDLIVKVGATPVSLTVPAKQFIVLYSLTSAVVSLSTVLGGDVQYAVGG